MGKLGGLQNEHQALRLRMLYRPPKHIVSSSLIDTGLSELLVPTTRSQLFNKSLEVQQSKSKSSRNPVVMSLKRATLDLLASYNISSQLNVIEDMIAHGADRQIVFRLLVLASVCGGGVKAKALENLKREILQVDYSC